MHKTINLVVLLLALEQVNAEDVISAAPTITNTKSFVAEVSQNWASVFYQVNMNLNDAKNLGSSGDYEQATSLYGTAQLPASYVPTWAEGFLERAHEGSEKTDNSEHSNNSSDESEESSSGDNSSGTALICRTDKAQLSTLIGFTALLLAMAIQI